jgi:hypothetical protein
LLFYLLSFLLFFSFLSSLLCELHFPHLRQFRQVTW